LQAKAVDPIIIMGQHPEKEMFCFSRSDRKKNLKNAASSPVQ
jgi:hypothetical protein